MTPRPGFWHPQVDDRVAAYSGVLAAGGRFVVAGSQADMIVLDTTSNEFQRVPSAEGHPIGIADDVAVLVTHNSVAGVDLDGTQLWSRTTDASMSWAMAGSTVLALRGPTGELSRIDPRTGQPTSSTQVGASTSLAASTGNSGALYAKTVLALLLLDEDSGEIITWLPTPPPVDEVWPSE